MTLRTAPLRNVTAAFMALGAAGALGSLGACNEVPVASLEKSFTMKVQITEGDPKPVKIDFLWIVDNSTSMCEEQVALTKSFQTFTERLNTNFEVDAQVAVTTADAQCDYNGGTVNSSKGRFNSTPASGFPPSCYAKTITQCLNDAECGEDWSCKGATTAQCMINPNGSINTQCQRGCGEGVPPKPVPGSVGYDAAKAAYDAAVLTANQECIDEFIDIEQGLTDWYCHMPSGSQADWGCMLPPQTAACPSDLPSILTNENLDKFSCLATVGVIQDKCFKYEQGLKTALAAVDPKGPNAEQAAQFLRPDAYLVIIFVTDEDDCSVPENRPLNEDYYDTCGVGPAKAYLESYGQAVALDNPNLLKESATIDQGGKLIPVSHFINDFKALKRDPSKVIVAAIAGDSTAENEADRMADRIAYVQAKGDKRDCHKQSYICNSSVGKSDWGSRYLELVEGFGPNGVFTNICNEAGIGLALDDIAKQIVSVVNKICLPQPIKNPASLIVRRTTDRIDGTMQTVTMTEGGEAFFGFAVITDGGEECKVNGEVRPAIQFVEPPNSSEQIAIEYQGDPFAKL